MTLAKDETLKARLPAPVSGRVPVDVGGVTLELADGDLHVESDAVTDAQLRASPVQVDTELPPAQVPTSNDPNAAVPAVVARLEARKRDGNWSTIESCHPSAFSIPPERLLGVGVHASHEDGNHYPIRTASQLTDSNTGGGHLGSFGMVFNGATWERARSSWTETVLAAAPRATHATSPHGITRGARAVIVALRVTAKPETLASNEGLSLRLLSQLGTGDSATLLQASQAPDKIIKGLGVVYYVLGLGASGVASGVATETPPAVQVESPRTPMVAVAIPCPPTLAVQVLHVGPIGQEWTYTATVSYVR